MLNTGQEAGPGREEHIVVRAVCTGRCIHKFITISVRAVEREREYIRVILKF